VSLFGTDGIRDRTESEVLAPDSVRRIGAGIGIWLSQNLGQRPIHVLIGRDTRQSGHRLFVNLLEGLAGEEIRVFDGGIAPTPAIAASVLELDLDLGIVITASHNPASDNGIKLFSSGGAKLALAEEQEIESCIGNSATRKRPHSPPASFFFDARRHYLDLIKKHLAPGPLTGWKIVVDCAHGATCRTTTEVLEEWGAQVIAIGVEPDGDNINEDCGSEHPGAAAKAVVENSANLGIVHDGDGDRLLLIDSKGTLLEGDALLAALVAGKPEMGRQGLVTTVMSSLAMDTYLARSGIKVVRTDVGDRNVYWKMRELGAHLGGESSGHFIYLPFLPTGDGLAAALLVLKQLNTSGKSLDEWAGDYQAWPQARRNLAVEEKVPLAEAGDLLPKMEEIEASLGDRGRLLLRYSGTERKIRLFAEAEEAALCAEAIQKLEVVVRKYLKVRDAL